MNCLLLLVLSANSRRSCYESGVAGWLSIYVASRKGSGLASMYPMVACEGTVFGVTPTFGLQPKIFMSMPKVSCFSPSSVHRFKCFAPECLRQFTGKSRQMPMDAPRVFHSKPVVIRIEPAIGDQSVSNMLSHIIVLVLDHYTIRCSMKHMSVCDTVHQHILTICVCICHLFRS